MTSVMPSPQTSNSDVPNTIQPELSVDQTAQAVAQIFNIDLSGCGNKDEGTRLCVDAIYQMIEQFQACVQENEEVKQAMSEMQDQLDEVNQQQEQEEQQFDEQGNPISEVEQPEESEDGQEEPQVPVQQSQQPATKPAAKPMAKPATQQQAKPSPFQKKKQAIAASHDAPNAAIAKMVVQNRTMRIKQLAAGGYITADTARRLTGQYTTPEAVALSLSHEDVNSQFDLILDTLEKNGPVISYNESNFQQYAELGNSPDATHAKAQQPASPLVADAESRSQK